MSDTAAAGTAHRPDATAELTAALRSRVLVIDGAMGTMIQQQELTEADFRGERFHGRMIRDIDHPGDRFAPERAHLGRDRCDLRLDHGHDHDVGTVASEAQGNSPADARSAARDDGDLAGKAAHAAAAWLGDGNRSSASRWTSNTLRKVLTTCTS